MEQQEQQQGKVCPKCKIWKPMEEFHKCKSKKDGRQSHCISCRNKTSKRITRVEIREGERKCTKCGQWKPTEDFREDKDGKEGRSCYCKECVSKRGKEYYSKNKEEIALKGKIYREENKEKIKERTKKYLEKNKEEIKRRKKVYRDKNKDKKREIDRIYREKNKEKILLRCKKYRLENKEKIAERSKRWYEANKEDVIKRTKEYYERNKIKIGIKEKEKKGKERKEYIQNITEILKEVNPILSKLPIFGIIYLFRNVKTGKVYVGQTIQPLKDRYPGNMIESWIKERKQKQSQKFLEELNKEDFEVEEMLDVGVNRYHLNMLEVHYINKYNSCENGYNNYNGHYDDNDGIEEFESILKEHGMKLENMKIVKI